MASNNKITTADEWLEEDNLMLLECWARDGYTFQDIANKIGTTMQTLQAWRKKYPEIEKALRAGREIVDYKVENALLKSALGYRTKETKVTTVIRFGKVVETIKETTEKDQAPNVYAAQCWLYNRLPDKWKNRNSRANILDDVDPDTSIQVTVTRASKNPTPTDVNSKNDNAEDEPWEDEVNESIEIRQMTEEEKKQAKAAEKAKRKAKADEKPTTKIEAETEDDPDFWPDDWEDEEDWED